MKKLFIILAAFAFQTGFCQNAGHVKITESKTVELTSELPKDKIDFYNASFLKFIAALKSSDRKAIDALISDKVKEVVTDNVIQKLSGGIHFDRKTEVYKSGYQAVPDGESYPVIQYRYEGDESVPPKDMITVVFENDGKILGVKPEFSK